MVAACREYELLIETLADGELDADQVGLVRRHMTECPACAAYHAELLALNDRLEHLALGASGPDIVGAVGSTIQWRLRVRFAMIAAGLLALKLLDLLGYLGSGLTPRLIVTAGAVSAFVLLGFNPLRLVYLTDSSDSHSSIKGERHASS